MPNTLIQFTDVDAGPFTITESSPLATLATGVTREQLLAGFFVTTSATATTVTVASSETCTVTLDILDEAIGYLNLPGTTHVESWQFDNQIKAIPRALTTTSTMGALDGFTIVQAGVLSGSGTLSIAGPAQTLGPFNGGGTVVLTATNTNTGITTVQDGATLQLGRNVNTVGGNVNGRLDTATANSTINVVGSDRGPRNISMLGSVHNGTVNFTGPDECGKGMFRTGANFAQSATGVVNITDSLFSPQGKSGATGTINVNDGGTYRTLTTSQAGVVNLNGCGWKDADCVPQGALSDAVTGTQNLTLNVQSETCIVRTVGGAVSHNGVFTGTAPVRVSSVGLGLLDGSTTWTNANNTYSGTLTADGTVVGASNQGLDKANIVLENGGRLAPGGTFSTITSLNSTDPTSRVWFPTSNALWFTKPGESVFAGSLVRDGTGGNVRVDAGHTLTLTETSLSNNLQLYAQNGGKVVLQGAKIIDAGRFDVTGTGSTFSAGTSLVSSTPILAVAATSIVDVQAISPTEVGLLTVTTTLTLPPTPAGGAWLVDVPDVQAGTYPILDHFTPAQSTANRLPATGVNNTGLTVTYAWDTSALPNRLMMTLA